MCNWAATASGTGRSFGFPLDTFSPATIPPGQFSPGLGQFTPGLSNNSTTKIEVCTYIHTYIHYIPMYCICMYYVCIFVCMYARILCMYACIHVWLYVCTLGNCMKQYKKNKSQNCQSAPLPCCDAR